MACVFAEMLPVAAVHVFLRIVVTFNLVGASPGWKGTPGLLVPCSSIELTRVLGKEGP